MLWVVPEFVQQVPDRRDHREEHRCHAAVRPTEYPRPVRRCKGPCADRESSGSNQWSPCQPMEPTIQCAEKTPRGEAPPEPPGRSRIAVPVPMPPLVSHLPNHLVRLESMNPD